jgi:hypothetical protein
MSKYSILLFIFLCGNQWVSAQENDMEKFEEDLIQISKKMTESRFGNTGDSLTYFSDLFSHKLYSLISRAYGTLDYPFKKLIEERVCHIATSKDGRFRIYSWDTQTGGTMHFFKTIYQYQKGDPGHFYSEIFTLKSKKKRYYLGIANAIYSTKDVGQSIQAFELTSSGLNDSIQLMKTPDGMSNSLDLYFDFFSVVDRPERPVAVIKYNEKKKIISISSTNDKNEIIPGNASYVFNGEYFERNREK